MANCEAEAEGESVTMFEVIYNDNIDKMEPPPISTVPTKVFWMGDDLAVTATLTRCKAALRTGGLTTESLQNFQQIYAALLRDAYSQPLPKVKPKVKTRRTKAPLAPNLATFTDTVLETSGMQAEPYPIMVQPPDPSGENILPPMEPPDMLGQDLFPSQEYQVYADKYQWN